MVGAEVQDISIPMHREAGHIAFGIYADGALALMIHGDGMETNWQGHSLTQLQDFFGRSRRTRANDFAPTDKVLILLGQYVPDNYHRPGGAPRPPRDGDAARSGAPGRGASRILIRDQPWSGLASIENRTVTRS